MANLLKLQIIGNLTRDPETRAIQTGDHVCSFDVAVNIGFGNKQHPVYVKVTTWRRTAEACQRFLHKGSLVFVDGEGDIEAWTKRDGTADKKLVVNARDVQFLDGRQGAQERPASEPTPPPRRAFQDDPETMAETARKAVTETVAHGDDGAKEDIPF